MRVKSVTLERLWPKAPHSKCNSDFMGGMEDMPSLINGLKMDGLAMGNVRKNVSWSLEVFEINNPVCFVQFLSSPAAYKA